MKAKKNISPPKWPEKLLNFFCNEEHLDILLGDIEELYFHRLESHGSTKAKLWYVKDALDMLRPFALKKGKSKLKFNRTVMVRNYFKISFRSMLNQRPYALTNLLGLSLGIACFLLISLFVEDELRYDRYHIKAQNIYRVVMEDLDNGVVSKTFTYTSPMHGKVLREEYPQVANAVRFNPWSFPVVTYQDNQYNEVYFNYVEPQILDIFTFEFLEGKAAQALDEPYSLIITESTARKYFGEAPALGKLLTVSERGNSNDFRITGVVKDFPEHSHMRYNFLASWITYERLADENELGDYYGNYNYPTYIELVEGASIAELSAQMPAMFDKYIDKIDGQEPNNDLRMRFQPLLDIHLNETAGSGGTTNRYYVRLFSAIGALILIIACINYMNLSTAKYAMRLKEIGVRKAIGAKRKQVVNQFLVEAFSYILLSTTIGSLLAWLSLPWVNQFSNKSITFGLLESSFIPLFLLTVLFGCTLLSGVYPSFFMAKFNAISILNNRTTLTSKNSPLRMSLVVLQFCITIGLIIGVSVVDKQIDFIKNQDLGYNRDYVVNFWASPAINEQLETFKTQLASNPNVLASSTSSRIPTGRLGDAMGAEIFRNDQSELVKFRLPFLRVDEDYTTLYEMEIISGSPFDPNTPATQQQFLINETAMNKLGFNKPNEAIGQKLNYGRYEGTIRGVVKDFNFESLHAEIMPIVMIQAKGRNREMSVKISGANIPATMQFLEEQFKAVNPDRDFNPVFLDDLYNRQYQGEQSLSEISKIFSLLAIFIACLGLLGLVTFKMEQKSKEISIRKVLGASIGQLLFMANKRYLILLVIAFSIATPVAYWLLNNWLDSFAYRIDISLGLILISGLIALLIASITISSQAYQFANSNPIKWLRNE